MVSTFFLPRTADSSLCELSSKDCKFSHIEASDHHADIEFIDRRGRSQIIALIHPELEDGNEKTSEMMDTRRGPVR